MSSSRLLGPRRHHLSRLLSSSSSSAAATVTRIPDPTPSPSAKPGPGAEPSPRSLKATLNRLFRERNPDKLAAAFIAASESYRFRCRHRIYDVAVRRLAAAGRPDAVQAVLEAQKRFPSDISCEGFAVRLITLYGKASLPSQAAATFHQLPALGCPRSVLSFNALLTAFADPRDFDALAAAFRDIPSQDPSITPNIYSYNILIRSLCEKPDLDAALDVLRLMEERGLAPDHISFNTLLNGFYGNGRTSDAEKIWTLMKEKSLQPDVKSFNAKIRGLVLAGSTAAAAEVIEQMRRAGSKPDTSSFNALIRGHCKDGNLEEAKRLYLDLAINDCAPNKGTFDALVPFLCEEAELDQALRCCFDCLSRKCFADAAVLQGVVDALVQASRMEEAKKLVEAGRKNMYYPRMSLKLPDKPVES